MEKEQRDFNELKRLAEIDEERERDIEVAFINVGLILEERELYKHIKHSFRCRI